MASNAEVQRADKGRLDRSFPKKRLSAGAAIFDAHGGLLIVEPTYREHWLLPGGICESGESPLETVLREVREELKIDVVVERLACVDHLSPHDGFGEAVHFLFECRPLDAEQIRAIQADPSEIASFRFETPASWSIRLAPAITRRLDAVRVHGSVYCEDGAPVSPLGGEARIRTTWPAA
jgi:8-oxo-dGTP diphosphatase